MKDVIFWSGGGLVARTRQSGGGYQKGTMSELQAIEVPGLPAVVVGAGAPVPWKADAWVKALARDPQPATGRPAAAATIARRLSCLSKFYDYGMREVELIEHSPVANVRRPKVTEDSPTIGLDAAELDRLLTAAEADGTTSAAVSSRSSSAASRPMV